MLLSILKVLFAYDPLYAVSPETTTNPKFLELLSQNNDGAVRAAVAANPKTPTHTLYMLAVDKNYKVSESANDALKKRI